jgi:ribosomal protein S18 acetylase RimI-like enzyme
VDDLGAARAAELTIARRAATEVHEFVGGWALRHVDLPGIWDLNRLHLAGPAPRRADDLQALADRWLAGLAHQRVVLDDGAGVARLSARLSDRGWEIRHLLQMAFSGEARALPVDDRARSVSETQLGAVQRELFTELAGDNAAHGDLLAAAAAALRVGTPAVGFGAADPGAHGLTCTATLFLDPDVGGRRIAVIDAVATRRDARERGLGRAVTCAAVRAAADWGAELITLAADAEDWPQLMYHTLGFEALGRQLILDRRAPG